MENLAAKISQDASPCCASWRNSMFPRSAARFAGHGQALEGAVAEHREEHVGSSSDGAGQNGFSTHEAGNLREHVRTTEGHFPRPGTVMSTFPQVTAPPKETS
ncbi:hypothetical protein GCM10017771_29640 [Streptomyces capitiformicae]|uniref:Uncharacterized protein n=1 Tax=Streptomyces capitiformicae TaxID=2014920 RepID=A0A919L8B3_9ACTN|nr:hypothetical protein GCM10017771_29640 [Streptomyces capitiformicae]